MSKSRNCNFQRNPPVEITTNVKLFLSLRCKVSGQNGLSPREDDRQRYDRETRVRAHGERFHLTPRTLAGCSLLLQLIARTKEKMKKRKGKKRLFAFEEAGNYGSRAYSCKHTRARTRGWLPLSCGKKAVQGWLKKEGPYGRQRPAPLCVGAPSLSHALFFTPPAFLRSASSCLHVHTVRRIVRSIIVADHDFDRWKSPGEANNVPDAPFSSLLFGSVSTVTSTMNGHRWTNN